MSVPAGVEEDEWPIGVSVTGQWGCDVVVLRAGEEVNNSAAGFCRLGASFRNDTQHFAPAFSAFVNSVWDLLHQLRPSTRV
ncbi:hypothetical protein BC835DRAFT_589522 [Cytidiella melzeri]|nr:hypothetical protein BC835DRAFT_589522 [Cytidiella melzeri]